MIETAIDDRLAEPADLRNLEAAIEMLEPAEQALVAEIRALGDRERAAG